MKLIFLYGPPGVGKLTVAKELAKNTGYKILHNHLTIDLIETIFDSGTNNFRNLIDKYRLDLIKQAAKHKIKGLIFTMCYVAKHDDAYIKKILAVIRKYRGQIFFIQLICDKEKLFQRIKHPARKKFSKIKKVKTLKSVIAKNDFFQAVPFKNNFSVNNTKLSPKLAALKIKKHFDLT